VAATAAVADTVAALTADTAVVDTAVADTAVAADTVITKRPLGGAKKVGASAPAFLLCLNDFLGFSLTVLPSRIQLLSLPAHEECSCPSFFRNDSFTLLAHRSPD
jgi:hypothetical protein